MTRNVVKLFLATSAVYLGLTGIPAAHAQQKNGGAKFDQQQIERGRYLVKVAGCNDCHTAGYAEKGGKVPEAQWLLGDKLGWRGPWGTTYAVNLRLYMAPMSQDQWVHVAKNMQARPPMPWFALHDMTDQDLRAIHAYVKSLGAAGEPAPAYVPPNKKPKGPYIQFPGK